MGFHGIHRRHQNLWGALAAVEGAGVVRTIFGSIPARIAVVMVVGYLASIGLGFDDAMDMDN